MKRTLGCCYYPEHWPDEMWADDARQMVQAGLSWVRIGEFAWSRLEPQPGHYDFEWLDNAIEILGNAGLKIILGTPTATPPRWMLDKHPDMLARDAAGQIRRFGSRRHYCFSHQGYKEECAEIVRRLSERYGHNPHIAAWQTDNEYGCHDTTISYSDAAKTAFQDWLRTRYINADGQADITALNSAWGNIFWSMEYDDFDQIELPNLTVTEPNPAHSLNFRRFSSDQVVRFNQLQCDIISAASSAPIVHNYMGRITDFDHFKLGADLDIASWDSYPLGFLEDRITADDEYKRRFARQGDPDFQAFHHDLYRAVGRNRWWVMEQQPGPVNWAPHNPEPLPGMVRLWSWEAFAHGAEMVCYFRWRQAPFAQEQMHAGLLRADSEPAPALIEAQQVASEIAAAPQVGKSNASVAILFDYDADAAWQVQPHGSGLSYFDLVFTAYRAVRSMGLSVDILPPQTDKFDHYKLVLAPGMMMMNAAQKSALVTSSAQVILGPRTAARDNDFTMPVPLPPHIPDMDVTVARVESLRADMPIAVSEGGNICGYREILESTEQHCLTTLNNEPVAVQKQNVIYLGAWLDIEGWRSLISPLAAARGLEILNLPDGVRIRDTETERFWFNYDSVSHQLQGHDLPPASVLRLQRTQD